MEPSTETTETKEAAKSTETSKAEETKKPLSNKVVIASALAVVLVVIGAAVFIARSKPAVIVQQDRSVGYSTEASVMLTQEELQAALDMARQNDQNGNVALLYKNNAYSKDGSTFDCYIVNSGANSYDMYLQIFADLDLTDELYLSQLVPPGSGFNEITLEHPLEKGDHTVYVCLTQITRDEETGEESILRQVFHTMDFHVT